MNERTGVGKMNGKDMLWEEKKNKAGDSYWVNPQGHVSWTDPGPGQQMEDPSYHYHHQQQYLYHQQQQQQPANSWSIFTDDYTGYKYWYNSVSGESQWVEEGTNSAEMAPNVYYKGGAASSDPSRWTNNQAKKFAARSPSSSPWSSARAGCCWSA